MYIIWAPYFLFFDENGWQIGILAVTLAYILDLLFGDPKWLSGRLGHPIVWMEHLIVWLENWLRNPKVDQNVQIKRGIYLVAIMVFLAVFTGNAIERLAHLTNHSWIITGVIGSIFFATRSLHDHVAKVTIGLEQGLDQARVAVSHIVGRNTRELDETGNSQTAIEFLAKPFLRQRDHANVLVSTVWITRPFSLPGDQHVRQHGRSPQQTLSLLWPVRCTA